MKTTSLLKQIPPIFGLCSLLTAPGLLPAQDSADLRDVSLNGGVQDGKARLTIEGFLGSTAYQAPLIFSVFVEDLLEADRDRVTQKIQLTLDVLQGKPKEFVFKLRGTPEVQKVSGEFLADWSVRSEAETNRFLVIRPRLSEKTPLTFKFEVQAVRNTEGKETMLEALSLVPPNPALLNGTVRVAATADTKVEAQSWAGLIEVPAATALEAGPTAFRLHGMEYVLKIGIGLADPEARLASLRSSRVIGEISADGALFTLSGVVRIVNPKGGSLSILSGDVALTENATVSAGRLELDAGTQDYVLRFDKAGEYPLRLSFAAKITSGTGSRAGWSELNFRVAPSPLQQLVLRGLPDQAQFDFAGAHPVWTNQHFESVLPADGSVKLAWKPARDAAEGKLFFSADLLGQVLVSPGLTVQASILEVRVMQGELEKLPVLIKGPGEVTRVLGENLLSWKVQPVPGADDSRRLLIEFNQPQRGRAVLQIQMQTPLAAFPQEIHPAHLLPEGATRVAGYLRVVNQGAVRIEVPVAKGLSQVSPDQFPESDLSKTFFRSPGAQRFAYRFAGGDFSLTVTADQVLPEISVSEILAFKLGENETAIDAELEMDVREAPLRELLLRIPRGYALARITASGLSDYFTRDLPGEDDAELRLVYSNPVSGRQVVQLRLERNEPLNATQWKLPGIEVAKAKSVRGHIGVSADPGYRLAPEITRGLTEIASAFFPRKVSGIQAAFRLSDAGWAATMGLQRLPQTVQVDAMHLFSIGEGIAYGSSVLNYLISGAPVSTFTVELSDEYFNVEFSGKDIRHWRKTERGYVVQLHTPVSGAYTLLATYERPFKAQGETLVFNGARPMDVQSEQGHTIIISAYQFQVTPTQVSPGLLSLETAEVPPEYRLFFDAPVLAAYRYTSRPFNLQLALAPLAQGDSLNLVVDRGVLSTQISKEGQVLTDVRYFVKSRGNPHFRVSLPTDTQLWSVTVDGSRVVPVTDAQDNLIPLPQRVDPNAILTVDMKLASRSHTPSRVTVTAPTVGAPVMLTDWKFHPDSGRRLVFRSGSLKPSTQEAERSGLAQWRQFLSGQEGLRGIGLLGSALGFMLVSLAIWRWTLRNSVQRSSSRFVLGAGLGILSFVLGGAALLNAAFLASRYLPARHATLSFLAPIQQAGAAAKVNVANLPDHVTAGAVMGTALPLMVAAAVALYGVVTGRTIVRRLGWLAFWGCLFYQGFRMDNGALAISFTVLVFLALHLALPLLRQLWALPPASSPSTAEPGSPAPVTLGLLILSLLGFNFSTQAEDLKSVAVPLVTEHKSNIPESFGIPDSVVQTVSVQDKFATGLARIRWNAKANQILPLVYEPAVMTRLQFPTNTLRLLPPSTSGRTAARLLAGEAGQYEIVVEYQVRLTERAEATGFVSPLAHGLVNRISLKIEGLDVEVLSPQAVSIGRKSQPGETTAEVLMLPVDEGWVAWRPRTRDVANETPVFYVEIAHTYVPLAGVIEGAHYIGVRPAQGQLSSLLVSIPPGTTVMDVIEALPAVQTANQQAAAPSPVPLISLWRYDPDNRQLRIGFSEPQSRPFGFLVRSQVPSGPLPVRGTVGLLRVEAAAGQIGSVAIATPPDVQLESAEPDKLAAMNLEDFPSHPVLFLQSQIPGLTVRRAFRYSEKAGTVALEASAVQPDIRTETQVTISLGEDRVVLAANSIVNITRAGVFKLSFNLPPGFDVETVSGPALSHWTESRAGDARTVTLHLNGKTEGQQQFAITLAGPGVKSVTGWSVPALVLLESNKERGTLLLVPEQGMRLQPNSRENLTQLDPQKSGVEQKGVLAFRVLQAPWKLAVDIEQVDAWVQVASLQHVVVAEAQAKVTANLHYQVENTGLKAFRVFLAANAENVRFTGEQVADFMAAPNTSTNGMQAWEIKLHRKVIGAYRLQCSYQLPIPENAPEFRLRGVVAGEVNMQRGFVTIESGGRLQLRLDGNVTALQPTEWQSIPQNLKTGLPNAAAHYTFRLVEPYFELPLKLDRHQAAKLLAARVNNVTLRSVISDDGGMLTEARIEVLPGDKRLLSLTLPKEGRFWFAFVNQSGVWPWRDGEAILIPLEQQNKSNAVAVVEVFYSSVSGVGGRSSLDLNMVAPRFDLPLENITWRVALDRRWKVKSWGGTLQLDQQQLVVQAPTSDPQQYLEFESSNQRQLIRRAEDLLQFGNRSLEQGEQQQARRAFQAAFGLSTHDAAFNEDARVQLHNLKVEQALVGLNVLQAGNAPEAEAMGGKLQEIRSRKEANYTRQDAEAILRRNSADENAALTRLAERIVQQQDAVLTSPTAIRASVPEQGLLLTFKRSVLVDPSGTLNIKIEAKTRTPGLGLYLGLVCALLLVLGGIARLARRAEPAA